MKSKRDNVFNLQGSIFQWANEGRLLMANDRAVHAVHPYNERWGVLLNPQLHPNAPNWFGVITGTETSRQDVMDGRLTLISGKEPLVLGPADGQETLARATDVFKYIDSNFEHWSCDVAGPATKETPVQVFEMVRDSTFQEMFGGFGVPLDRLALTQAQIKNREALSWLAEEGR